MNELGVPDSTMGTDTCTKPKDERIESHQRCLLTSHKAVSDEYKLRFKKNKLLEKQKHDKQQKSC
jgi:hypothetical protein